MPAFRPGLTWWFMGVFALGLLLLGLAGLLGWWGGAADEASRGRGFGQMAMALVLLVFLVAGWRSYRVKEEGLEVRFLGGRRAFAPWSSLGAVGAREMRRWRAGTVQSWTPNTEAQGFMQDVRLEDGRPFTRIGPWTARRRELVREIRRRIREAAEARA